MKSPQNSRPIKKKDIENRCTESPKMEKIASAICVYMLPLKESVTTLVSILGVSVHRFLISFFLIGLEFHVESEL